MPTQNQHHYKMIFTPKKILLLLSAILFLVPFTVKAQESTVDGGVVYLYDTAQGSGKNGIIYPVAPTNIEKIYLFFHDLNPPACTINCHKIDPVAACNEFGLCQKVGQLKNIVILFPQLDPRSGENPGLFTKAKFDAYISEAMAELHAKIYSIPASAPISVIAGHGAGAGVMVKYLEYFSADEALVFDGCSSNWCNKIILSSKVDKKSVYIATTNNYDTYNQIARQNDTNAKVLKINTSHYQVPGKCFSDHVLNNDCAETADPTTTPTTEESLGLSLINELTVDKPTLAIRIPGLNFSNISSSINGNDVFIHLSWLPEFISIIYRFGISIISIVAVIIIILAGVQILTSGGGEGTSQGYKKITHAVIGLLIAWGSFAILYNINPALVQFNALKVQIVELQPLDEEFDKGLEVEYENRTLAASELDPLFAAYAACYGYDPAILKAVATVESGLKPYANPGAKYQGLFQMDKSYCETGLKYGQYPSSLGLDCNNRINPETNTAAAAATIYHNLTTIIQKNCPQISVQNAVLLLYVGHNNGPGVLGYVVDNKGCTSESIRAKVREYYETKGTPLGDRLQTCNQSNNGALTKYATKYSGVLDASTRARKCVTADWGEGKYAVGIKAANLVGSAANAPLFPSGGKKDSLCPKSTGKRAISSNSTPSTISNPSNTPNASGRKILAVGDSLTAGANSHAVQLQQLTGLSLEKVAITSENTVWMYDQIKNRNLKSEGFTDLLILGGVNDIQGGISAAGLETRLKKIYQKAKAEDMRVIALTITPFKSYGSWNSSKHAVLLSVNNWIRSRGEGNIDIVVDAYQIIADPADPQQINHSLYGADEIHFNAAGHAAIANEEKIRAF